MLNQTQHNVKQLEQMSKNNQIPFKQSSEQIDTVNFRLSSTPDIQYEAKNSQLFIQLKNQGEYNPELIIKHKDNLLIVFFV